MLGSRTKRPSFQLLSLSEEPPNPARRCGKRETLLRTEDSALPFPAFPLADRKNNPPAIPFLLPPKPVPIKPSPGPLHKSRWIQSKLRSLQLEFDAHFRKTNPPASESPDDAELADEEPEIEEEVKDFLSSSLMLYTIALGRTSYKVSGRRRNGNPTEVRKSRSSPPPVASLTFQILSGL